MHRGSSWPAQRLPVANGRRSSIAPAPQPGAARRRRLWLSLSGHLVSLWCHCPRPGAGNTCFRCEPHHARTNRRRAGISKEEETVSIATRHEQPISQAPSNVYVITDEDIRHSGATDIPTTSPARTRPGCRAGHRSRLQREHTRRQPTLRQQTPRHGRRSIDVHRRAGSGVLEIAPVTLPEIKRIEVLKGPTSSCTDLMRSTGSSTSSPNRPRRWNGQHSTWWRRTRHHFERGRQRWLRRKARLSPLHRAGSESAMAKHGRAGVPVE